MVSIKTTLETYLAFFWNDDDCLSMLNIRWDPMRKELEVIAVDLSLQSELASCYIG